MNDFFSSFSTGLDNFFDGHITSDNFIIFLSVIMALFILSYIHNLHSPYLNNDLNLPKKRVHGQEKSDETSTKI